MNEKIYVLVSEFGIYEDHSWRFIGAFDSFEKVEEVRKTHLTEYERRIGFKVTPEFMKDEWFLYRCYIYEINSNKETETLIWDKKMEWHK